MTPVSARPDGLCVRYRVELGRQICHGIAEGLSLSAICESEGMPTAIQVQAWIAGRPAFAEGMALAREALRQRLFDEVRQIADGAEPATLQVARTRITARQWLALRLAPKRTVETAEEDPAGDFNVRILSFAKDDEDGEGEDGPAE